MNKIKYITLSLIGSIVLVSPSLLAEKRGVITSGHCPYSCASEGIPKKYCKDWKEKNWCFIEDLRHSSNYKNSSTHYSKHNVSKHHQSSYTHSCFKKQNITEPRINISSVRREGGYRDSFRVTGSVEGQCLTEAGAYESNYKVGHIQTSNNPQVRKYGFSFVLNGRTTPSIKVYTTNGYTTIHNIDPYAYAPQYSIVYGSNSNGHVHGANCGHSFYNNSYYNGYGYNRPFFGSRYNYYRGGRSNYSRRNRVNIRAPHQRIRNRIRSVFK